MAKKTKGGNGSPVVEGLAKVVALKKTKESATEKKVKEAYKKYPHIVAGSIRDVTKGEAVNGVVSKGRMCTVQCVSCGEERTVNMQDVFQCTRCAPCKKKASKERKKAKKVQVG